MFDKLSKVAKAAVGANVLKGTKNVTVLGAAGGIGQPLSLLLAQSQYVKELSLFDIRNSPGVAADIGHIDVGLHVKGFTPENSGLESALEGADVVVIPAGMPRKPGMSRDDLFEKNASVIRDLTSVSAKICPKAKILIVTNPVNSTVPIAIENYKKHGVDAQSRIFGVTTLDLMRSSKFVSEILGKIGSVPVVGGHAGTTIIPLLSQVQGLTLESGELAALTKRIQFAGDEVVKAKAGTGSATLSMAMAAARFTDSILRASLGESCEEWAFVRTDKFAHLGLQYFSSKISLGKDGLQEVFALPENITPFEQKLVEEAVPQLQAAAKKGIAFI